MGVLQTSLRTADGAKGCSMSHPTILWLIPRLQETTLNKPCSGLPAGTTPTKDLHINLKHLWGQWRPSARIVTGTPGRHNARISTQTMRNHFRRFTLHAQRPYRGPILNRQRHLVLHNMCAARLQRATIQCLSFLNVPHTGLL